MIIYLDLDDVIADFKSYAKKILGHAEQSEQWSEENWNKLRSNSRLYRDLEKTPEADALIEFCRYLKSIRSVELRFLTAVPRGNDIHWAFYDKFQWTQKFYPDIPVMFGPYSRDKKIHCKPGDILIDDKISNCQDWKDAGGYAIQHDGNLSKTLRKLIDILERTNENSDNRL